MIRDDDNGHMGRRRFAGMLAGILLAFFALLTGWLTRRTRQTTGKKEQILPASLPEGISFHGSVIAVRKGDRLNLLSSQCTHLGCRISESSEGILRCPCHGSEFAEDGTVVKGPAVKALKRLEWKRTEEGIVVRDE
jgi:Rieske Fe-S protein